MRPGNMRVRGMATSGRRPIRAHEDKTVVFTATSGASQREMIKALNAKNGTPLPMQDAAGVAA